LFIRIFLYNEEGERNERANVGRVGAGDGEALSLYSLKKMSLLR
jgi:hypothetical protein